MTETFTAMMIEDVDGKPRAGFKDIALADLPDYPVLVEISHSTLNYKDGLAITGRGRIARRLPMVAGIDLAGIVVEDRSGAWKAGDKVILNGFGLSETEWGAYSRFQRVRPEWLLRLPTAFTPAQAMGIGTAGYTAALCVMALENWGTIQKDRREVLVTGAAGGVGSTAISLLAKRGYKVTAATGRPETHAYLSELGATAFVGRSELAEKGTPLQKERWAGVVDSVGSTTLANAIAQTVYGGAVAACGLAGGADLPRTVLTHILRSVALLGVGSVSTPIDRRQLPWTILAESLDSAQLDRTTSTEQTSSLPELAKEIIAGNVRGRIIIEIGK